MVYIFDCSMKLFQYISKAFILIYSKYISYKVRHMCIYVCVCIYIKWGLLVFSSRMLFLFV